MINSTEFLDYLDSQGLGYIINDRYPVRKKLERSPFLSSIEFKGEIIFYTIAENELQWCTENDFENYKEFEKLLAV